MLRALREAIGLTQATFDAYAANWGRAERIGAGVMAVVLPLLGTLGLAIAIYGVSEVWRDARLLWFGIERPARIEAVSFEPTRKRKGIQYHMMEVSYGFEDADGVPHSASTRRHDLRQLPDVEPGDVWPVVYRADDPSDSDLTYRLGLKVYGMLVLLPMLGIGIYFTFAYTRLYLGWRFRR